MLKLEITCHSYWSIVHYLDTSRGICGLCDHNECHQCKTPLLADESEGLICSECSSITYPVTIDLEF
jgi:predicted metal-binding protein